MRYGQTIENNEINYQAIREQKKDMLQRFLKAKKNAEQNGQVVTKPI